MNWLGWLLVGLVVGFGPCRIMGLFLVETSPQEAANNYRLRTEYIGCSAFFQSQL